MARHAITQSYKHCGSTDLREKKRKRSGRKPLVKWWFTKRQSPVQSQTTRFTTKSLSSQASQHVQRGAVVFHLILFCSLKNCSLIHFFWKTIFLCEVADYKKCSETNEVSLNHNDSQRQSQKSYTEKKKLHVSNFLKPYHIYSCFSETMQFPSKSELQYIEFYSFIIQLSLALF